MPSGAHLQPNSHVYTYTRILIICLCLSVSVRDYRDYRDYMDGLTSDVWCLVKRVPSGRE